MKKKFKAGDIVRFGYGAKSFPANDYSAYRTILLLEKTKECESAEIWRAHLINDTSNYYDDTRLFIVARDSEVVWRDGQKKALDAARSP